MTFEDVRMTAQLVAAGRVFSITDASLMALARRVLDLEGEVERWVIAANQYRFHQTTEAAVAAEREACAKLCDAEQARWHDTEATDVLDGDRWQHRQQANTARDVGVAIRARGGQ